MFWANVRVHLIYFRRSRLILVFGLVMVVLAALFLLPALFVRSRVQGFGILRGAFVDLNELLILFSAALGLVIVSSHLRAHNLKMIFTKPCPPALWVGSVLTATVTVTLVLDAAILAVALAVSVIYRLPIQGGLAYIAFDSLIASIGMITYLMFLAMVMHPLVAGGVALLLGPWTFSQLEEITVAGAMAGKGNAFLRVLRSIFHFCYIVLPMVHACGHQTKNIYSSLRVGNGEWRYILYSLGYALALAALCYCLALFFLQRKQLN
jgi:hypothetical protein